MPKRDEAKPQEQIFCPYCNAQGVVQPVLAPLHLKYDPVPSMDVEQDYGDRIGNPQWRFDCERCKFSEIHVRFP